MNKPKYKEMYLKEKMLKEDYKKHMETLIDRLKLLDLISRDEIKDYNLELYRVIEIKKDDEYTQMTFLLEGKDDKRI